MNDNTAFNEMMIHLPLCTHKEPSKVLIIGDNNDDMKEQALKHSCHIKDIEFGNLDLLHSKNEKDIDIIILTSIALDEQILANISRILKNDGLITFASKSFSQNEKQLKDDLLLAGSKFWISMPFRFGHKTSIIASKKYHPTADIILQRSDLLDDLNYYSSELHLASFVFPAFIHKALTGISKR